MNRIKSYILIIMSLLMFNTVLFAQIETEQQALQQVSHLKSEKKWGDAIEIMKPIYERSPFDEKLYDVLLDLYIGAEQWDEAYALNERMLGIKRGDVVIALDQMVLLRKQAKEKEAHALMDSLIQVLPSHKIKLDQIALKLEQFDWYEDAIKVYLKGRELLNSDWLYASELAYAHLQLDKIKEAAGFVLDMASVPRNSMEDVQEAMMRIIDVDSRGNRMLRRQLQSRIKDNPNDYKWNELWNWFLLTQGDREQAVKEMIALDKSLEEDGKRVVPMARYFTNSHEFDLSLELWNYVIKLGENQPFYESALVGKIRTYLAEYELNYPNASSSPKEIEKDFNTLLEAFPRQKQSDLYRNYIAFQVNYLQNITWGIHEIKGLIESLNKSQMKSLYLQSKLDYADYLVYNKEIWEAAIILGQIDKEDPQGIFGEWSRFKSAELAFYRGDFTWAKQVLDILKAATTDYIANDALALSVLISENASDKKSEEALHELAKIKLLVKQFRYETAIQEIETLLSKAQNEDLEPYYLWELFNVYSKSGDVSRAESTLKGFLEKFEEHVLADDATYQLAMLYHHKMDQPSLAAELYEDLILNYPASTFVISSRKALKELQLKYKNL